MPADPRPLRNVLMLQGPVGPFFRRFADELIAQGITVTKVNFNPGDDLFFRGPEVISFREPLEQWGTTLEAILDERDIDGVFLFGDCRPMHVIAVEMLAKRNIPVWVFEEGYLRPDFVTMELGGVNGNSPMPKDPAFYRRKAAELPAMDKPEPVGNTFPHHALWAALNSVAVTFFSWRYPHYQHHRDINSLMQVGAWLRGTYRKVRYSVTEADVIDRLTGELDGRYFLVPLQVHCDAQLHHSPFASMEEFIETVVKSFASDAPAGTHLVLKHHPHDRAYRDYTDFLDQLGQRYQCGDRLIYVHDLHLPTMLKHAHGVITMNSTVGTSALYHKTPVKVLGDAVYDIPELTFQGSLSEFFRDPPGSVDTQLFEAFSAWMRHSSQINGSFYRRLPEAATETGLAEELRPWQRGSAEADVSEPDDRVPNAPAGPTRTERA